MYHIGP